MNIKVLLKHIKDCSILYIKETKAKNLESRSLVGGDVICELIER